MLDDRGNETGVFDFDELANHLLEQGLDASPADIHGCLCGLLAAGAAVEPELALAALADTLDLDMHGELAELVMQLYKVTASSMRDEEFDFHPLLPDDESDIGVRAAGLADWCRGFLAGFALVSAGAERGADNALTRDSAEILKDIAAIAQAEPAAAELDDEEAAEENYFEIVEYLRVATINIYLDGSASLEEPSGSTGRKRPLH